MFAKAVECDPRYARAYAGLAACDASLYSYHVADIPLDGILELTAKALALDPGLAEAHASRGLALLEYGRSDEAAEAFERALALDPKLHEANFFYARFFYARGDFERVAELLERAAQIRPDDYRSASLLVSAYRALGRTEDRLRCARLAVDRAERELSIHPENGAPALLGAVPLADLGERDRAREWAARAISADPDDGETQYIAACAYAQTGDVETSIDLLEKVVRRISTPEPVSWMKNDPDLDPLRSHPRYRTLIASLERE
jgi:adenylate cyclase